jgi:hypothetical protein
VRNDLKIVLAARLALLIANPISAENSGPTPQPVTPSRTSDAAEIVCEKLEVIGSRLATKKICMTRSQWADLRRQDRQAVEKAQASPCMLTHNGTSGRPSC